MDFRVVSLWNNFIILSTISLVGPTIEEERRRVNGIARPSASFVRKETLKTLPDTHNSTFALRSTRNRQWAGHLRSESEIPEGSQRDFWLCCLRYFFRIPLSGNVYTIFFRPSAPRTAKLSSRKPSYGPVYPVDPPSLILYAQGMYKVIVSLYLTIL